MNSFFKIYRTFVSPFLHVLGGAQCGCRFYPTCSEYAEEVIKKRGILFGSLFAIKRILSCHPFSKGGFDPVRGS